MISFSSMVKAVYGVKSFTQAVCQQSPPLPAILLTSAGGLLRFEFYLQPSKKDSIKIGI